MSKMDVARFTVIEPLRVYADRRTSSQAKKFRLKHVYGSFTVIYV